jgi:hypothetical protein
VKREEGEEWGKEAAMNNKNRIMIYGPKNDGTYIVEFNAADGDALAISVPPARRVCSNISRSGASLHQPKARPHAGLFLFSAESPSASSPASHAA